MSAIQKEANRQDNERLQIESTYYPLFVGLFNKINRYLKSHFSNDFNGIDNLDIDKFRNDFKAILNNLYKRTQKLSYIDLFSFIIQEDADNLKNSVINLNKLENENNIINNLYYIINTTKNDIKDHYNKYNDDDGKLSDFIYNEFKKSINNRSAMISQQNVGIAYESQKINIAKASQSVSDNLYKKIWLTMGDNHVRLAHREVDMQEVYIDSLYIVDGENLMYPKDMSNGATINNTINCRCISIILKVNK